MRTFGFLVCMLSVGACAGPQPEPEAATAQFVPIRHVGADELAGELVKQAGIRGGWPVGVTVDPRTNSLILDCAAGQGDELAAALKRVAELDDSSRTTWTGTDLGSVCGRPIFTHVVFLRFAPVSEVAEQVGCLHPGVRVAQDPQTNSLEVWTGSEQALGEALVEIGRLDREEPPQH